MPRRQADRYDAVAALALSFDAYKRAEALLALPALHERFGVRSVAQLRGDLGRLLRGLVSGSQFQLDVRSVGLVRPALSLPAYAGLVPADGLAPIYNLFDRSSRPSDFYSTRVSRRRARDFRGGRLAYDDHDGTDFVCPLGAAVVAPAPGIVALQRDYWLRGGLTLTLDHGGGLLTHCSHLARVVVSEGQRVARGEVIAVAGASGVDLTTFFPWVPPHIHFMAWLDGRPVDPFAADDERSLWATHNQPLPSDGLPGDAAPEQLEPSPYDPLCLERLANNCEDEALRREIDACRARPHALAALLDDALVHQVGAWPRSFWGETVRPQHDQALHDDDERWATLPRLTLPLSNVDYSGARFADAPWTAPR